MNSSFFFNEIQAYLVQKILHCDDFFIEFYSALEILRKITDKHIYIKTLMKLATVSTKLSIFRKEVFLRFFLTSLSFAQCLLTYSVTL